MTHGTDLNYVVLNFDLDTKRLKEYYPKSRRSAYLEIQRFLESNGFEHRQWSGYVSSERRDVQEVCFLLKLFGKDHPWMEYCTNQFDVSEVKNKDKLSVLHLFSSEENDIDQKLSLKETRGSLMDQFKKASAVAKHNNFEVQINRKDELEID